MKKFVIGLVVLTVLLSTVTMMSVSADGKGEKGFVVGTVIEASTYAIQGLSDPGFADAAKNRANQGFPVGIIDDETGDFYVCIFRSSAPASPVVPGNKQLVSLMGQKAIVQGIVYKAKGVNVIRFSNASEY